MRASDREFIFGKMISLVEALQNEISELNEVIEYVDDRDTIAKRVARYEEEADTISHDINYYYRENSLSSDNEAMAVYAICESIEELSDLIEELAYDFVRYNIQSIRENSVISFVKNEEAAAKLRELVLLMLKLDRRNMPFQDIIELDQYKGEARRIYNAQMQGLFTNAVNDPVELIRWQEIYKSFMHVFEAYEKASEACAKYLIIIS